ncbi:DNA mismatch repair endonuclease MutL [Virgibacillus sp. W0430]|uniref:DNA mismatch repair endonuclease MutL n=1 Tax=Virgibacillus sp. W0430 TaxID=3391580 RepID=UPI003F447914
MKIIQLPDILANKIAAGEVVERPASVVKELIENSIDAQSTVIKVEIQEAGLKRIKITDNGEGMSGEDCERAFLRHATSKIKREADLFHIKSLGFRGEALASIASVSKLTIKTSTGNEASTYLTLHGGNLVEKKKADARKGTEITVRDLFYNTPARLKYMKTIHTELSHITDLINRLALAHPKIRFEVIHNNKQLFQSTGNGDVLQVIAKVYGTSVAKKMLPVAKNTLDFTINGYISLPEVTRASRTFISTIINGRYIKSMPLIHAILRAYHTLLPIHRSPIVVLSIQMDPILVDVNVHPTKLEVRFSKEKELIESIESMIKQRFRSESLIPEFKVPKAEKEKTVQQTFKLHSPNSRTNKTNTESFQPKTNTNIVKDKEGNFYNEQPTAGQGKTDTVFQQESDFKSFTTTQIDPESDRRNSNNIQGSIDKQDDMERIPALYAIGQYDGTYILAQNEKGLYMIDQHAAQERIKYEFYKLKLGKPINQHQQLLIPMTFEFSKQESLFIEEHYKTLQRAGLFLESFGEQSYIVRSHPSWFPKGSEEEVIRELVEQVIRTGSINIESIREESAILMSCKRSIKANHFLNKTDMDELLEELRLCNDPFTCPHGRPIIVHFSNVEIEKMFKRIM